MKKLENCVGCMICEIMCSYANLKKFQPSKSAIKVQKMEDGYGVELLLKRDNNEQIACVFCKERLCVKYCSDLRAKKELELLIRSEEQKFYDAKDKEVS